MTIEELRALIAHRGDVMVFRDGTKATMNHPMYVLAPEILALVEAASEMRLIDCRCIGDCECFSPLLRFTIDRHKAALAAFNAKLEAL